MGPLMLPALRPLRAVPAWCLAALVAVLLAFAEPGGAATSATGAAGTAVATSPASSATREAAPAVADPALEARVMAIAEELRCLVCQNETLAASQADLAVDLRRQIALKLQAGQSHQQIIDFLVERYGDFVLYRPPLMGRTLLLWFGPFALLLVALGALVLYIRGRRQAGALEAGWTPEQAQRARALLDEGTGPP